MTDLVFRKQRVAGFSLGIACLLAGGCATGPSASLPTQLSAVRNFQRVSPGIYRGAQPDDAGMEALKAFGIKTILCLRVPPRVIRWEGHKAEELDMDFVSLPLSNYDSPSDKSVRRFLDIITDPARQPVFVHCRQGQLRTGALMASYQVVEEDWSAEEAYAEAKRYGFDDQYPWYLPLKWFVNDLDRHTAALPDELRN